MNHSLLILGCGGHGRVIADAASACGYEEIGFLDDADPVRIPPGTRVLGPFSAAAGCRQAWPEAIAAVGDGRLRMTLLDMLRKTGFRTPNIIHPSAVISRGAVLGEGVFVAAGAIVSTGARIGDAVIVNTGARIDHDCRIGEASHVAPGTTLSGNVRVGAGAWLGTGCSVRQGVTIGAGAVVGVGAAVVGDLEAGLTYVGVPARLLEKSSDRMPSC